MKVSQVKGSKTSPTKGPEKAQPAFGSTFSDLLSDQRERRDREQLEQMMQDIRRQGDLLADAKHIEILVQYKNMVKSFVSEAVEYAFAIEERRGLSRMGRSKVLKVVAQIDDQLIAITDNFLAQERSRIKLLSKIGELQGLLMNLYV